MCGRVEEAREGLFRGDEDGSDAADFRHPGRDSRFDEIPMWQDWPKGFGLPECRNEDAVRLAALD